MRTHITERMVAFRNFISEMESVCPARYKLDVCVCVCVYARQVNVSVLEVLITATVVV
jgi:hypothetical protein